MSQTFYKPLSQINMASPATNLLPPPPPLSPFPIFQFPDKYPLPPANSQPLPPFPPTPNWIIYYLYIVLTFINIKWKEYGIQQKEYSIQRNGNSAWWGRGVPEIVSAQVMEWAYGPDKQIQVRIPETSSMSPGLAWVVFTLRYIKDVQTTPSMTLIHP